MTDEMLRAADRLATAVDSNFSCDYQQIVQAHRKDAAWAVFDYGAGLVELALALDNYRRLEQRERSARLIECVDIRTDRQAYE
jgi:hypothetical protein